MCDYNFNCLNNTGEICKSFIEISYQQLNNLEQESCFYYVCYNPRDEPHLADLCFHARSLQIPIAEISWCVKIRKQRIWLRNFEGRVCCKRIFITLSKRARFFSKSNSSWIWKSSIPDPKQSLSRFPNPALSLTRPILSLLLGVRCPPE